MFTGTRKQGGINNISLKLTSVIFVGSSSSSGSKTNRLKGEAAQKAYFLWKACINSGVMVRITIIEGQPVSLGFCRHPLKNRYIDFEIECADCKNHKMTRTPPKHERTALRKARIGTARRRSIVNRKALFDTDKWKVPGTKKH